MSPPPDVPPIFVTTTEGDDLESEETISNKSSAHIPVVDVYARNFKGTETQFKNFGNRVNSGYKEVPPTPEALADHYFNEDFMFTMVGL